MKTKLVIMHIFICICMFFDSKPTCADLLIETEVNAEIELIGYNSLDLFFIYKGGLNTQSKSEINTSYQGLALLVLDNGPRYPVIIGDKPFTLNITDPNQPPTFTGSESNDSFYKALQGGDLPPEQYTFARLLIQAKQLLQSSGAIKTVEDLKARKKEFHEFVAKNYDSLRHSDMIIQLIGQYFMMHEYVDYHAEGQPATDIRDNYQQEVINGVKAWLEVLQPHLPDHEILNHCVSLYYNRSMVSMAALIVENFRDAAYCPGPETKSFNFPDNLPVTTGTDKKTEMKLSGFKGGTTIAFVSTDCPVSMVETVAKARQAVKQQKYAPIVVVPLQPLSDAHLSMNRMLSNGKLFFINDEEWRKTNLPEKIRLPLFVEFPITGNSRP